MSIIRDLLTPEAHRDPYTWGAVLLAHVAIGCMGWVLVGWWIVPAYMAWEVATAALTRLRLYADAILDWVAVTLGACIVSGNEAVLAVLAVCGVLAVGIYVRRA